MDARKITDRYHVSPQIDPEDAQAIADAGYSTIICNRPDGEVPPSHQSAAVKAAAEAAGLKFEVLELTHQTMTPENVARQRAMIEASQGPVLAYCASGTRCSVIWALSQAGTRPTDEILSATSNAGYQLDHLRPMLDQIAQSKP